MKKYGIYLMMIVTLFSVTSCGDDDDNNHQEEWMITNLAAFNAIKTNPEYKELVSPGNEGSIYYKVLEAGTGTDTIRYTSTVSCYYKGSFVAGYPEYDIEKGDVFDQRLFNDGSPYTFTPNSVIAGWKTALQNMVKGDKWEIWVPYQLGYGRSDYEKSGAAVIPGYSTLVFELEVVDVKGVDD
ncbi:MAG: FKBP-type peptidyl-prolyl cis-trans isomerase [Tannerella sp.]|jgi:peptidylprolyl isomerase/FKBP-type peptidyl-prolyl cis-trans isomerase FklB|nr:FKBP-type peptidyl-prolyl cis-trans isomerase [Tannerella sp.]